MSDDKRTPEQIQADLARTRQELAGSVDELSTMLDPREQIKEARTSLKAAVSRTGESARHAAKGAETKAQSLLDDAKGGDPKAIGIVGAGAAALALVITVVARRSR
ncbi:MAG TPA: DUF3618 domain-containing protein [Phototrophicaceae bacterium]|uniref:DUF3618 domain-containing protein n=1 Tax=Oceanitalea stevensii TaxID=2763072 RepID=A0ABR8Z0G5_9MICO|nr:DUF3618 domain-containing protein [Oceanitalea stevensii]MBD8061822.1 DUF3618 domain-containing protein [Oceanitalea stevensii]HLT83727.1 DUF3618 domain-containing protein [Phototrophicaceae bacterium]